MVRFLILRHGLSEGNVKGVFSGHEDVALSRSGQMQAQDAADYILKNYKVNAIYSSDLRRAVSTVTPVSECLGIPIVTDTAFREIDTGIWCGVKVEEVERLYPDEFKAYKSWDEHAVLGRKESFYDVKMRVKKAMERIAEKHDGQTVLIGAHGGVVYCLGALYSGRTFRELRLEGKIANASLTVIEFCSGVGKVVEFAKSDYLKEYEEKSNI